MSWIYSRAHLVVMASILSVSGWFGAATTAPPPEPPPPPGEGEEVVEVVELVPQNSWSDFISYLTSGEEDSGGPSDAPADAQTTPVPPADSSAPIKSSEAPTPAQFSEAPTPALPDEDVPTPIRSDVRVSPSTKHHEPASPGQPSFGRVMKSIISTDSAGEVSEPEDSAPAVDANKFSARD